MSKDKDLDALESAQASTENEVEQEENLEWLLDMESYDTEETLFKVEGERYEDKGLSAFEAEMAERPMTRGNDMGDDLANYVDEEIVISSESSSSDIYSSTDDSDTDAAGSAEEAGRKMAIDFSRRDDSEVPAAAVSIAEGADILGLANEDDMGETYMTIRRARNAEAAPVESAASIDSASDSSVNNTADTASASEADAIGEAVQVDETTVVGEAAELNEDVVARADSPAVEQEMLSAGFAMGTSSMSAVSGSDVSTSDTRGPDADFGNLGPDLDALEDAPVPSQVAQPESADVANQGAASEATNDQDLPPVAEEVLTDSNLDEELTFSIEDSGDGLAADFDPFEKDEVVLFETDEDLAAADALLEQELEGTEDIDGEIPDQLGEQVLDDPLNEAEALADLGAELDQLVPGAGEAAAAQEMQDENPVAGHDSDGESEGIDSLPEFDMSDFATESLAEDIAEEDTSGQVELSELEFDAREHVDQAQLQADVEEVELDVEDGEAQAQDGEPLTEHMLSQSDENVDQQNEPDSEEAFLLDELPELEFGAVELEAQPAPEAADQTDESVAEITAEAITSNEAGGDEIEGFGEDIFGDDFADDLDAAFGGEQLDSSADIDSAFSELAESAAEDGDSLFADEFDQLADPMDAAAELEGETLEALDAAPSEELPLADNVSDAAIESAEEAVEELTGEEGSGSEETVLEQPIAAESIDHDTPAEEVLPEQVEVEHRGRSAIDLAALDSSQSGWAVPAGVDFSESSKSGGDIFADFLDAFVEEGSSEIEKLEDLVSEWEKDVGNQEIAAEVGRTLHTVKGIAKGVGLQRYGTLIHNFETLLEALPEPAADEEQVYFRIINVWLDALVRGIEFIGASRGDVASELPVTAATPEKAEQKSSADNKKDAVGKGVASKSDKKKAASRKSAETAEQPAREEKSDQQLADEGAKALTVQQSVRITSDTLDHWLNLASQTQQLCVRASQTNNRGKRSTAELQGRLSSVRTHIGKIADRALLSVNARGNSSQDMDALEMDQYSELQEAASILREGVEDLGDLIEVLGRQNNQVETLLKQQSSVISSISSSLQGSRVVPVSRLMPGLRRIVRTVSTDLGKVVTFRVLNEVGALDRDHHARLQVVLEHMVRNALDHGIELPDERLSAGKPNAGRITVDVVKSGGDYVIKLADDGRGIDADAIRESARSKGLDFDVDALSDDEVLRLIFHKGFSTADKVSEISGRGVGMEIVLTELQQLGGDIQIQSAPGQGTTFVVRIPSNVTVNGALMVTAGDDAYAIPLNGLIAVEQVPAEEFFAAVRQGNSLQLFDMDCEPAYLATLCQGVGLPERGFWESFVPVIIAGSEDRHMAIAIDNVQEALELVVRSLGSQFSTVPGLAGAATTADGEAIVALDLNLLVESVGADGIAPIADSKDHHQSLLALVVDDSRTQRMVATSQLDAVGVETVTAENGQVAIDLLNATHRLPDVVLLDVEMPVKDGIETLREIRKSQRYGHLPVIMVTSRTGAKHRALAKSAGCNAYMGKPFNFPALVEQINVLTRHNLQLS
ncbi:MAG: hypothetical protein Hals2KO_17050 [Halioglobus sp.]